MPNLINENSDFDSKFSPAILAVMMRKLRNTGFKVESSQDVKNLLKKNSVYRDGTFYNFHLEAAYELATYVVQKAEETPLKLILAGKLTNNMKNNDDFYNCLLEFSSIENERFSALLSTKNYELKKDMIFSIFKICHPFFLSGLPRSDFNVLVDAKYPFHFIRKEEVYRFSKNTPINRELRKDYRFLFFVHENIENLECADYIANFDQKIANMNPDEIKNFIKIYTD